MKKVVKVIKFISSLLPSKLPVGMTEFEAWASDIIAVSGAPDNDSVRFALATMILHADATAAFKPKFAFVLQIRKSMANQIAAGVVQDLKAKQQAEMERQKAEAEAAAKLEATPTEASPSEPQI